MTESPDATVGARNGPGTPVVTAFGDQPFAFDASNDTEYDVPLVNPVTVADRAEAAAATVTVVDPAVAVTRYPVTAEPPSSPGADHDTTNRRSRPNVETINGTDETVAGNGTTTDDARLDALVPAAFVAVIVTVYATLAHTPRITTDVSEPGAAVDGGATHADGTPDWPGTARADNEYDWTFAATSAGTQFTAMPRPVPATFVITGPSGATVNTELETAVPPGVLTLTGPVVDPAGTTAVNALLDCTVNDAATPLNRTAETPSNPVPFTVTVVPTAPDDGDKEVIVGIGRHDAAANAPTNRTAVPTAIDRRTRAVTPTHPCWHPHQQRARARGKSPAKSTARVRQLPTLSVDDIRAHSTGPNRYRSPITYAMPSAR